MAMISVMLGDQSLGSHTISHVPFIVGRDPTCDAQIDNLALSRHHCQFTWADGSFRVEDLKSANGTFLNGERVESAQVKDGDELRLGKYKLVFHQAPGEPAPPARGDQPTSLAEMLGAAVEPPDSRPQVADSMKTFQMSADLIRAHVAAGPSVKGARAAEVARSMGDKESPRPPSRTALYVIVAANAVVIIGLVAVVVYLLARM